MTAYASNSCCGISRDRDRALIGGVCAGLARHFGFNLKALRIITLIGFFVAMPFVLIGYIIAVLLMPSESYLDEYVDERAERRRRRRQSRRARREAEEVARQASNEQVAERARALEERLARIEKYITSSRYKLDEEFDRL